MKKTEVLIIMRAIQNYYPNFKITEEKRDFWAKAMQGMDASLVEKKLLQHVKESRFTPTIADISAYPKKRDKTIMRIEQYNQKAISQGEIPEHLKKEMGKVIKKLEKKVIKND